jgi:hypothetical protein
MNVNRCLPLAVLGSLSFVAPEADAQACRGRPGFGRGHVHVNAGAMLSSEARSMSGGATIGAVDGLLLAVGAGYVVREASPTFTTDQTGTSLAVTLGASVIADARARIEVCPLGGLTQVKVTGDFHGTPATLTQNSRRAGASAGYSFTVAPNVVLIPFASAEYVSFGGSVKGDAVNLPVPDDTYTPIAIGLGLVRKERLGWNASVTFPVGIPTGKPSFVTTFSIALGS